jgi:hypothetical protein
LSSIICWEEEGLTKCGSEEDLKIKELEERLKQHLEAKLSEMLKTLVEQYEIEITVNVAEGKGVGRWRKKR